MNTESNPQLTAKFRDQSVLALPPSQVDRLIDLCWRIDDVGEVGELVRVAAPPALV